jgi:pimeloyl-[acyl-carrier protein] methyl ester esterase
MTIFPPGFEAANLTWATILQIAVEGGLVEAEVAGEGAKRAPILFLHGWTLDRRMWAPQMRAFSVDRKAVAIDRRGFGGSTAPAALDREADDIAAVLDALSIKACVVVGMSQAGRVALDFALRYPERTSALVLQGAHLDGFVLRAKPADTIPLDDYRALVAAGKVGEMRAQWRAHSLMRTPNTAAGKIVDEILSAYDGRDLLAPAPTRASVEPKEVDRIAAPALIVTGDAETPWRRLVADALAYAIPNASRAVIADAGHICNLCNSAGYNAALTAFLSEAQL